MKPNMMMRYHNGVEALFSLTGVRVDVDEDAGLESEDSLTFDFGISTFLTPRDNAQGPSYDNGAIITDPVRRSGDVGMVVPASHAHEAYRECSSIGR